MRSRRVLSVGSMAVAACVVLAWATACAQGWVSPVFFPSPRATWAALTEGLVNGPLAALATGTAQRMVYGWGLACLVGVVLGALVGSSDALRAWVGPTLELMRPLPASAIVPVVIALVGLSDRMVLIVIVFGSVWPVLLGTMHGFATTEPRLREVSRLLRLSRLAFIAKIGLPNAMPDALAGMRQSLTIALILAVVGEMLASQQGLGTAILLAARSFRAADLFAGVALLCAIGLVSNAALGAAERRLLQWKKS